MLASPALGDIQLSMCDKRGNLEVEVIRARGLQCKPGSKTLPGTLIFLIPLLASFSSCTLEDGFKLYFYYFSFLKKISAPWVKVYLVSGKRCLAKAKTATARRTLDPLYQQQLVFHEKYQGCVLQVSETFFKDFSNEFDCLTNVYFLGDHLGRLWSNGG